MLRRACALLGLAAAVALVAAGCGGEGEATPAGPSASAAPGASTGPPRPGTVTVFAAASLTGAFEALAPGFEAANPGVKVRYSFAGSSSLATQVQQGAPADVFASADEANMEKVVDSGDVGGGPEVFANNRLQVVVAAGNPEGIRGLADLARPGLAVALCAPAVPAGRYAAEAFAKAGVAPPPASQELDVKAVVTKVSLGEADAGVVYTTDVRAGGDEVAGVDIPESQNVTARYPIATLDDAANPEAAAAFVDFVLSPEGQAVLAAFGFLGV